MGEYDVCLVSIFSGAVKLSGWISRIFLQVAMRSLRNFFVSGSARVVVPARPKFEGQVQIYVDTGVVWGGGPIPAIDHPEYLSVADEIRVQTGAAKQGEPGDWWHVELPTSLVAVDTTVTLPLRNTAPAVGPDEQPRLVSAWQTR